MRADRFDPLPDDVAARWSTFGRWERTYFPKLVGLVVEEHKVDYGVLIPLHGHSFGAEAPEFAAALCHAVNEWVREAMLDGVSA